MIIVCIYVSSCYYGDLIGLNCNYVSHTLMTPIIDRCLTFSTTNTIIIE